MPIETDAQKIQLMLETMGIDDLDKAELAYDRVEKQIREVETASRGLKQQTDESKKATYDLVETEYQLVEAETEETKALAELMPARLGAANALKVVEPEVKKMTISLKDFSQRSIDAEKAVTALATGHGMMRLGPALERIATTIGGPVGIGFAIGAMATAMESMLPHFLKWINADNAKHAKDIADATQKQADAAKQMAETLTTEQEKTKKATEEQIKEMPGARVVQGITGALMAEALAKEEAERKTLAAEMKRLAATGVDVTGMGQAVISPEKRLANAKQMAEAIATTLGTSAESRREALRLNIAHPGVLPPEFAEKIGAIDQPGYMPPAERDKAMQAQRAAEHEIKQLGQKEVDKIRANIVKRQADAKHRADEWEKGFTFQARVEDEMRAEAEKIAKENAGIEMRENEAAKRAAEKRAREAAHHAKEVARVNTPEARMETLERDLKRQVQEAAMRNWPGDFNIENIKEWVAQALKDLPMNNNNVAWAMQQALGEVRMHLMHQAEMQNQQWQNWGGMRFQQGAGLSR